MLAIWQSTYLPIGTDIAEETLSPLLTMKRGFSMTKKDGKVITSTKELKKKDKIELTLTDGTVNAEVI